MRQCGLGDSDYSGTPCDSVARDTDYNETVWARDTDYNETVWARG